MPRDANGNYTLPSGNPVIAGTPITTSWANPTLSDVANEITNSLSRNGEGGMLVPFQNLDGAVGTPGITWTNETKTGLYRAGTNDMRVSVNATDIQRWTASGTQLWNGSTWENIPTGDFLPLTGGTLTGTGELLNLQASTPDTETTMTVSNSGGFAVVQIGLNDANKAILRSSTEDFYISSVTSLHVDAPTTNVNGQLAVYDYLNQYPTDAASNTIHFFLDDLGAERGRVMALVDGSMVMETVAGSAIIEAPSNIYLNAGTTNFSGNAIINSSNSLPLTVNSVAGVTTARIQFNVPSASTGHLWLTDVGDFVFADAGATPKQSFPTSGDIIAFVGQAANAAPPQPLIAATGKVTSFELIEHLLDKIEELETRLDNGGL